MKCRSKVAVSPYTHSKNDSGFEFEPAKEIIYYDNSNESKKTALFCAGTEYFANIHFP